jgi:hypothetical protein
MATPGNQQQQASIEIDGPVTASDESSRRQQDSQPSTAVPGTIPKHQATPRQALFALLYLALSTNQSPSFDYEGDADTFDNGTTPPSSPRLICLLSMNVASFALVDVHMM